MSIISWGHIDEATIVAFEQKINLPLPTDYRAFLQANNGASVERQVFFVSDLDQDVLMDVFFGVTNAEDRSLTLLYWLDEFGDELQEKTLIIGSDPGGGIITYVTVGEDKGIYYWDHSHFFPQSSEEEGNTYFVASSFDEFIAALRKYEPA